MTGLETLEKSLGYCFKDVSLLERALTHPSCSRDKNNQRLEFLGDAVLQLTVSDVLFHEHTKVQEGALTNLRQHLVCQDALAAVARRIGLGTYLRMDKGCELGGGRENDSVLCDACEAVLASVYLDGGFDSAMLVLKKHWPLSEAEAFNDAKSALQEYLQKRGRPQPKYILCGESGPDHMPTFTVKVTVEDKEYATGTGNGKKKAEQAAAEAALKILKAEEKYEAKKA